MTPVETVMHGARQMAIVIRGGPREPGTRFVTPRDLAQQVAVSRWERGKVVAPHRHPDVEGASAAVVEVLVIQSGVARIRLFAEDGSEVACRDLAAGDAIVLIAGAHGLEALETVDAVLVRQGPVAGNGKVILRE